MVALTLFTEDHSALSEESIELCPRLEDSVGYSLMDDSVTKRDRVLKEALQCRVELLAYARSLLGNCAAAEDVVQEAFLVVMKKFDQFQEGTSMLKWCRSFVRVAILRLNQQRQRERACKTDERS